MADAPHPTAASAYPVCSIDSVHDVHATYTANGFFVMPRLLSKLQVNELASVVHSYVHRGGPLLRKNAAHSGYGPSRGGWIVLDFPSEPALFPLLAAVDESAAFHDALRGMFRGREYRLLSRNDVYVDYATGWHYDSLQRSHRLFYTFNGAAQLYPHLCSGPRDAPHHIVTVAVYLQTHADNADGLNVQALRTATCTRNRTATVRTQLGDVVVFDTRLLHRGKLELSNPLFGTGPSVAHRSLYTLTYGTASCWSDGFERAHHARNSVMNNASRCGLAMDEARPRGHARSGCESSVYFDECVRFMKELKLRNETATQGQRRPRKRESRYESALAHAGSHAGSPARRLGPSEPKGRYGEAHGAAKGRYGEVHAAVVVGASRGIGNALMHELASGRHGAWRVIVTTRTGEPPADAPAGVHTLRLDVNSASDRAGAAVALRELREREGTRLAMLLHCAGVGWAASSADAASPSLSANASLLMTTNAHAPYALLESLLPELLPAGHAEPPHRVCILTSDEGSAALKHKQIARHKLDPYGQSKLAANAKLRELAPALRAKGVAAVALHPGWVRTLMGGITRARLSPNESAHGLARVCTGLVLDDSGKFLDWQGHVVPW